MSTKHLLVCAAVALCATANLRAVTPRVQQISTTDDWCREERWSGSREGVCEVREYTLPATGAPIFVDARPNGGIKVEGEPRRDVLVRAKVVATARTLERARQIASGVQVNVGAENVAASGPGNMGRDEGWWVSYRLAVPEQTPLSLRSTNGGIGIDNVEGHIEFATVNGGVKLSRVGGDVRGRTSNGGIDVELDGTTWQGEGLDVETNNGGVKLSIPQNYSARLEAATVNGGFKIDIPITVQGRIDREVNAQLGSGGPLVRVRTTNGGVKIMGR